jgi:hypothetical protein
MKLHATKSVMGQWREKPLFGREITDEVCSATGWKQFLFFYSQRLRQKSQFFICHTSNLGLNFGYGILTYVPTDTRTTCRQHGLRPTLPIPNFSDDRADDVLRNRFTHNFLLTVCDNAVVFLPISEGIKMQVSRIMAACIAFTTVGPTNFAVLSETYGND